MGRRTTAICRECHAEFKVWRQGATTCSFKCQLTQWGADLKQIERARCAYCGDPATDEDHIPPRSAVASLRTANIRVFMHTVPSCAECNSAILNRRALWTFAERAAYVADALPQRLAKALACPDWDDEDLEELGPTLRQHVEMSVYRRRWAQDRCDFAEATAITANQWASFGASHLDE